MRHNPVRHHVVQCSALHVRGHVVPLLELSAVLTWLCAFVGGSLQGWAQLPTWRVSACCPAPMNPVRWCQSQTLWLLLLLCRSA